MKCAVPTSFVISWSLLDLPTAQHRAGLAGLVFLLQSCTAPLYLLCELHVEETGATLRLDEGGLDWLLNHVFAARMVEYRSAKKLEGVPLLRTEEEQLIKRGKTIDKTWYVYAKVEPLGGPLSHWEPVEEPLEEGNLRGSWLQLWRSMLWGVYRGVPTTRLPFQRCAQGESSGVAAECWDALRRNKPMGLKGALLLGSQTTTSEKQPMLTTAAHALLLFCAPFAVQVYLLDRVYWDQGAWGQDQEGYVLVVPDVLRLKTWCDGFPSVLRQRTTRGALFPAEAHVTSLREAGFHLLTLCDRHQEAGQTPLLSALAGLDVYQAGKEGDNVVIKGMLRVGVQVDAITTYRRLYDQIQTPLLRTHMLDQLDQLGSSWKRFDRYFQTLPVGAWFPEIGVFMPRNRLLRLDSEALLEEVRVDQEDSAQVLEVLRILVNGYLHHRIHKRYSVVWADVQSLPDTDPKRIAYRQLRQKVGREAYLQLRGARGASIAEFVTSKLCSGMTGLSVERLTLLQEWTLHRTDELRTLALLVLTTRS